MNLPYSRSDEEKLPHFKSHDEARAYFKEKHGDAFQLIDSLIVDDEKVYLYDLIFQEDIYREGHETLDQGQGFLDGVDDLLNSYQRIEIYESGHIHMIH